MSVVFDLRGTSKIARYANGLATPSEFGTITVQAGDISSVLNQDQGSFGERGLVYSGYKNIPLTQQFSIAARVATGSTTDSNQIFNIAFPANRYGIQSRFNGAGAIVTTLFDAAGATNVTQTYAFAYAANTYYDLLWKIDTSVTVAGMILSKDGADVATTTLGATRAAMPSTPGAFICIGTQNANAQNSTRLFTSQFYIDNAIVNHTTIPLTTGTGLSSGRTAYIDTPAFTGGTTGFPFAS